MNGDRGYGLALLLGVALLSPAAGLPAEPLPPEVEAIRAEREAQRAALDRIRRKVEALREAEARGGSPVSSVSSPGTPDLERAWARHEAAERERERERARAEERARQADTRQAEQAADRERERLHAEAEARWREGERRLRVQNERIRAEQAAREQVARQEQAAQEAEDARRLEARWEQERLAAKRHAEQNQTLFFLLATLYGALCFLPFFPLYRDFIEAYWQPPRRAGPALVFAASGACCIGVVWMSDAVSFTAIPDAFLLLGFLGLYFWFFVPGLVAQCLLFLHSLFVPHPLETAFQRVLRGETISRDEAARVAEAIRTFYQNGSPADWRVKSALARLERLAKLMGRENAFVDFLNEYILHQHERPESGRRSTP